MSEFELRSLLIEYGSAIDAQSNFWLTATFAVVVASHIAGHHFNRWGRGGVVLLYLLACTVFYLRYISTADLITSTIYALRNLDIEVEITKLGLYTRIARQILMLGGTVFAVLIVVRPTLLKSKKTEQIAVSE